jgi:Na+/H+-translocating membrane pyrophosphatase
MESYVFAIVVVLFFSAFYFLNRKRREKDFLNRLVLFPHWLKPIGIVWALLSFVLVAILDFSDEQSWKVIANHSINFGLFFVCFARDKQEDELSNSIRLHAFYTSMVAGFCVLVLIHFFDFILGNTDYVYPARQFVTLVLGVYAFRYAAIKRKVFYGR